MYAAPEIYSGDYTEKCDIWSCGVMAYVLLSGNFPFDSKNKIMKGEFNFDGEEWNNISDSAKDAIKKMLELEEEDRPSAQQILDHDWIKNHKTKCPKELIAETLINIKNRKQMSKFLQVHF